VRHDDGSVVDDGLFALCQNTNPYTFLGNRPFNSAPDAGLDKPLTMITIRDLDLIPTLTYVLSALASGVRLRRHRHVVYSTGQHRIEVTGHGPFPYQVDGDYLGDTERLIFEWRPEALRLVVP
jgi:diacylglycerol kinase family enzyme